MRRYYNATFTYLGQKITVSRQSDEDMERWARYEAEQGMLIALRKLGLFRNSCLHSKDLVEVKRKDTVSWKNTVEQIRQAEESFKNQPASTNKLIIAMANANGVTV